MSYNQVSCLKRSRFMASFRKHFSTRDLLALNLVIEKCNEYNKTLCVGFVDYEKAFHSVEHFVNFETLLKIGIHPTYIKILQKSTGTPQPECIKTNAPMSLSQLKEEFVKVTLSPQNYSLQQ